MPFVRFVLILLAFFSVFVSARNGNTTGIDSFSFYDDSTSKGQFLESSPYNVQPIPYKWKGFLLFADLVLENKYTDNYLVTEENVQSDYSTLARPHFKLERDWNRHYFLLEGQGELIKSYENEDENVENYSLGASAQLEATHALEFPVAAFYSLDYQERSNRRETSISKTPLRVETKRFLIGMDYNPNRLSLALMGKYEQIRLENNSLLVGGGEFITEDRDVNLTEVSGSVSYDFRPNWSPFLNLTFQDLDYVRRDFDGTDFNGITRDNKGLQVLGGLNFNYKDLIYGDFAAGWSRRKYSDPSIQQTSGLSLKADIGWHPIKKSKWNLQLSRAVREDNLITSTIEELSVGLTGNMRLIIICSLMPLDHIKMLILVKLIDRMSVYVSAAVLPILLVGASSCLQITFWIPAIVLRPG